MRCRYLSISHLLGEVSLVFEPTLDLTLGSQRRAKDACRFVLVFLKWRRIKTWKQDEQVHASVARCETDKLPSLLFEIDAALDAFRRQQLHPRVVEEILGIAAEERRRWTKDGRLPQSGSRSFRRGQSIHFALHPAAKTEALARRPEKIEAWRTQDKSASLAGVGFHARRGPAGGGASAPVE
jgi:hypothetical protein